MLVTEGVTKQHATKMVLVYEVANPYRAVVNANDVSYCLDVFRGFYTTFIIFVFYKPHIYRKSLFAY